MQQRKVKWLCQQHTNFQLRIVSSIRDTSNESENSNGRQETHYKLD